MGNGILARGSNHERKSHVHEKNCFMRETAYSAVSSIDLDE